MSVLYWVINFCLIMVGTGLTVWLGGSDPAQMFEKPEAIEQLEEEPSKAASDENSEQNRGMAIAQHIDALWQKTLFRPERTEAVVDEESEEDEEKTPKRDRVQMELVGLGEIGDKSAAVIRVKKKRRGREEEKDLKKNVYRLGDSIRDTGFKVSDISLDGVTVTRGDETRELTLTKSDAASKERREEAVQAEKKRERERKKQEEKQQGKDESPQPPPPPPAPGDSDGKAEKKRTQAKGEQKQADGEKEKGDEELTRRERIKRALEARRRILEKRRKAQQNENK